MSDEYTIPLGLWPDSNRLGVDQVEYHGSWYKYETLASIQMRHSDTVVVSGYGVHLKVEHDSLIIEYEQGHVPGQKKSLRLDRGVHEMKQIFIASHGGYVSFEAMDWCTQQEITVTILNWRNDIVQVLTPQQHRNARLVHLQYMASESKQGVEIARELVRCKTLAQIGTLKILPSHPIILGQTFIIDGQKVTQKSKGQMVYGEIIWNPFEERLEELAKLKDVPSIRLLEAQLALRYWNYFIGISINWKQRDAKIVPAHWKAVTERGFSNSNERNPRHALSPFHAVLNFAYALLKAQILQSILIHGLDETVGYLHVPREEGQPLVYDIMEGFRSYVDAEVLDIFSKTVFERGDFIQTSTGECQLNEGLRRYIVAKCRVPNSNIDAFVERIMDYLW